MKQNGWVLGALLGLLLVGCGGTSTSKSAADVVDQLKAQGIPIGQSVIYTAETDPNHQLGRPNGYASKVNFNDTRLKFSENFDTDSGGSIEVYPSSSGASERKKYIDGIGKALPGLTEYSYLKGSILLRVSHVLTPDQAKEYEGALKKIK